MMQAILALSPCAVALVAILVFNRSGLQAAGFAVITALLLWQSTVFVPLSIEPIIAASIDTAILTLLVAAMVVPGIFFVEVTQQCGSPQAMTGLVRALALPQAESALLIAIGIGVLVESLTGMGVSLLITVPLLLTLVPRLQAIGLALIGMSLMPWGALAISAHIGAELAHLPLPDLAWSISLQSGPVAATLPLLCLWFVPHPALRSVLIAGCASLTLVLAIITASRFIGIEVAGVAGGLAVIVLLAVLAEQRDSLGKALMAAGLRPYAILIGIVVAQKFLTSYLSAQGISPSISSGRVSFVILSSPGVALLLATLISAARQVDKATILRGVGQRVGQRAWRPVLSVALFMLTARLLVELEAITVLAELITETGPLLAIVGVTLLGALGGFATGSGVTGNALFMPSAAAVGENFGHLELFAALQNGASGHFGMTALPVAALLLAALPKRQYGDDRQVLKLALGLAAVHISVLLVTAMIRWGLTN